LIYVWKRISRYQVDILFTEFQKAGNELEQVSPGRPCTSEEGVESKGYHVYRMPNKPVAHHSLQLGKPETIIQTVLQ
jgi:hypothetical protein